MRFGGLGLQGKFVVALLVAAALPFLVGLVVFESKGYQHLLQGAGKIPPDGGHDVGAGARPGIHIPRGNPPHLAGGGPGIGRFHFSEKTGVLRRPPDEIRLETRRWMKSGPRCQRTIRNSWRCWKTRLRQFAEIIARSIRKSRKSSRRTSGGLVAATGKTSDFDQADEAWWQKGATLRKGGQWTDVLRLDASSGVFSLDVVVPLHEGERLSGVAKMSVDVTSLFAGLVSTAKRSASAGKSCCRMDGFSRVRRAVSRH